MCGQNKENLTETKISQALLNVCDSCSSLGTDVEQTETDDSPPTADSEKTNTQSETNGTQSSTSNNTQKKTQQRFDDSAAPLAPGYGKLLETARDEKDLTIKELADELNEKASLLRKIESEEKQPTATLQEKLENHLGVSLSGKDESSQESYKNKESIHTTIGDKLDLDDL
jgi:putative transcription factor